MADRRDETRTPRGDRIRYHYKAENADNLPRSPGENGRDHGANRYISQIEYGNS